MELVAVGPDLYACLQPDEGLGTSNSGLVARGGGTVVDTFYDLPRTRALRDLYATVLPEPAVRVVNTHHNGDHCWGNQIFADAGAEVVGHVRCAERFTTEADPATFERLAAMDPAALGPLAGFAEALRAFDFSGIVLTPPTVCIDDDTTVDADGLEVRLLSVGPAHTAGDVVVHVPEHGVVYAGDVLFHGCTPIGWEGTFDGWIGALERIAALEPDVVVPGHGPLARVDGVLDLRDYLTYVRDESRSHFEAGRSVLDAAARIELGPYAGWTEPERIVFSVDRAYRELRGDPWDTPVDARARFGEMVALRQRWADQSGGN